MDLLSLAPAKARVQVGDQHLDVSGLSLEALAGLCLRFPALLAVVSGGEYKPIDLLASPAASAIIAAGCGYFGNDDAERKAGLLDASTQFDLMTAIITITFPGGSGPFARKIAGLVSALEGRSGSEESATSSQTSPNPSTSLSAPDTASAA